MLSAGSKLEPLGTFSSKMLIFPSPSELHSLFTHPLISLETDSDLVGLSVGDCDGDALGAILGFEDGDTLGLVLGDVLGLTLGLCDGDTLGLLLGLADGLAEGLTLGLCDGDTLGLELGDCEGEREGALVGSVGVLDGDVEGLALGDVGLADGAAVGLADGLGEEVQASAALVCPGGAPVLDHPLGHRAQPLASGISPTPNRARSYSKFARSSASVSARV